MAQGITAFVIFILVAGGVIVYLNRRTRDRMRELAIEPDERKPRFVGKRQQRLLESMDPPPDIPTIEQLVAEEAAATGVNDIAGGDGLDVSLKLRVYWRDEVVRQGCRDGVLEFRVDPGVAPADAQTEDVRLVCVRATGDPEHPTDAQLPDESADSGKPETGGVDEPGR